MTTEPRVPARDRVPGPVEFATRDPERAHAFLVSAYVENTMRIRGRQDGFRMSHTHHELDGFSIGTLTHSTSVEHRASPLGYLLVGRVLRGRFERETEGETLRAGVGDVFLIADPARPYAARWEDVELELTRLDPSVLAAVCGDAEGRVPRPAALAPTGPGRRQLNAVLDWVTGEVLANPEAAGSPLVVGGVGRLLAGTVLTAIPHAVAGPVPGDRADATPAALRRAIEYIDARVGIDIGLADVAAAAGVTPRAVHRAFQRHLGTTPGAYLRRLRMERAHCDLLAADPTRGDTVVGIATRWGFAHQGRFASAYRRAYGVLPGHSLRR